MSDDADQSTIFCEQCGGHRDRFGDRTGSPMRACSACGKAVCVDCWNQVAVSCMGCVPFALPETPRRRTSTRSAKAAAAPDASDPPAAATPVARAKRRRKAAAAVVIHATSTAAATPATIDPPEPLAAEPILGATPERRREHRGPSRTVAALGSVTIGAAFMVAVAFSFTVVNGAREGGASAADPTPRTAPGATPAMPARTGGEPLPEPTTEVAISGGAPTDDDAGSAADQASDGSGSDDAGGRAGPTSRPIGAAPSNGPSATPGGSPTTAPATARPKPHPTPKPTVEPTPDPTPDPTVQPTPEPTPDPTPDPTPEPTPEADPGP